MARRSRIVAVLVLSALAVWLFARRSAVEEAVRSAVVHSHLPDVEHHAAWIVEAANESRVDPNLLAAIMLSESGGRVGAVSKAGALGLFQLMLPTARERAQRMSLPEPSRDDLLEDGRLNTRLAAHYVKWLEQRYAGQEGQLERMLIAYNAGPGRLERWIGEAGGWSQWRREREVDGESSVLRYASKVTHYRDVFATRGRIAPACDHPPAPEPAGDGAAVEPIYGPLLPQDHVESNPQSPSG